MAGLGAFLPAGPSCIIVFTFVSCTLGQNIVDEILQRLDKIEEFNSNLKMDNSNLKSEIINVKRENSELVETVNKMKVWMESGHFKDYNKIVELNSDFKTENFKLELELADLRNEIHEVRRENCKLRDTVNEIKVWMNSGQFSENNKSDARIKIVPRMPIQETNEDQKATQIRSTQRINPPAPDVTEQPVAFYAYMDSYHTSSLPIHTTLVFETVQLNDGHGYSKHDGVFIAPRTGVYVFHWTIQVDIHAWASIEIVVNGTPIGCAASDTLRLGDWGTGSGLVVTRVNTGDHVFLRTQENATGILLSNHRARTTFSGWLLYS